MKQLPPQAFKKGGTPWNKGRPMSEETKRKVSEAKSGKPAWNKGKPAPWTSLRNAVDNRLRGGDRHWNWRGGTAGTERHRLMQQIEYKQWRSDVFTRDNWTCQGCQARGTYIEAHHIKSWSKFAELRYELDNGVTLCLPCHRLTDNYMGRARK